MQKVRFIMHTPYSVGDSSDVTCVIDIYNRPAFIENVQTVWDFNCESTGVRLRVASIENHIILNAARFVDKLNEEWTSYNIELEKWVIEQASGKITHH